ncbi:MAG: hypothetical protein AB8H86_07040 [Polyangiales bacterium]
MVEEDGQPSKRDEEGPVPRRWRATLESIVHALVEHDFRFQAPLPNVLSPTPAQTKQMREYVADYGERLCPLTEETWDTSVCLWDEDRWSLLVDLRTEGEGRSDLALSLVVYEDTGGYRFELELLYVP